MRLIGVDGCRSGWVAVVLGADGPAAAQARIVPLAEELLGKGSLIAIDIPIGLMDAPSDGPRPADHAARAYLSERNQDGLRGVGSRVFGSPTRAHLDAVREGLSYAALRERFPKGQSISKQAFHICPKIAELDDLCRDHAAASIWEAHPEVAFARLAGKTLPPKKTDQGRAARRAALTSRGFDLDALAAQLPRRSGAWAMDDLYDACALTLSAGRIAEGTHLTFVDPRERDRFGLRRAIHA